MLHPKTILITDRTNIRYLSGFSGTSGYLIIHGRRGFLLTDSRYHLLAKRVLPSGFSIIDISNGFGGPFLKLLKKLHARSLGFESGAMTVAFWKKLKKICRGLAPQRSPARAGLKLVDIGNEISKKRIIKTKEELVCLRKAQSITDRILKDLRAFLRAGMSEKEIAREVEIASRRNGGDGVSFPPIIAINDHSACPHHSPAERKLKRGDMILIDMGVTYKGYCSDMTRVLFTKEPTAEQSEIYALVAEAQSNAIEKIKAGVTGVTADRYARSVIEEAGYGAAFGHSLGHGVGMDIHELPNLSSHYKEKIPAGTVVTVEPGVYLPGKFGVRLEDMVTVTQEGAVNLTKSPKKLKDCIIQL